MVFAFDDKTGRAGPCETNMAVLRMPLASVIVGFLSASSATPCRFRLALLLLPGFLLAACGPQGGYGVGGPPYSEIGPTGAGEVPQRYYPPPGPPEDPWGPYIREAGVDYHVPERWIRAVMQQESGGEEQAVSPVGAMGLMQIMPETYEGLRERYGFGADPFNPHNNILAGTAYIREMYDLFGSPGFLAAYNAGPDRIDDYLAGTSRLPAETVNYVAAIAPNLGDALPPSGPLAAYVYARPPSRLRGGISVASLAAGCDLNAAYDPNHPCTTLEQAAATAAPEATVAQQTGLGGCDLDAAYDPAHPCNAPPKAAVVVAQAPSQARAGGEPAPRLELAEADECDTNAAYDSPRPCRMPLALTGAASLRLPNAFASAAHRYRGPVHRPSAVAARGWAIQVGAFASPTLARRVAEGARHQAPKELRYAALALPPTPYRHGVLYRARLANLSERAAADACSHLNHRQLPCVIVKPSRT